MQWKSDFETGIDQIDLQHKQLVETISKLEAAALTGTQEKEMGRALKFLVDYTHFHFSDEESFMHKAGFPELEAHKEMHKVLVQQLMEVLLKLKRGEAIKSNELIDFLINWLSTHILDEDKKIGAYVTARKEPAPMRETGSPDPHETDILKKLQKLKTLVEKKLISGGDYEAKKAAFLKALCETGGSDNSEAAGQRFSFIGSLQKSHLITKEEEKEYKTLIFKQINLESYLNSMPDIEKKFQYLKSIHDDHFISGEEYENMKSKLLQDL